MEESGRHFQAEYEKDNTVADALRHLLYSFLGQGGENPLILTPIDIGISAYLGHEIRIDSRLPPGKLYIVDKELSSKALNIMRIGNV